MKLMTVRELVSDTGMCERSVRSRIKSGEFECTGEMRGREKLYLCETGLDTDTYNRLKTVMESGTFTLRQAEDYSRMVEYAAKGAKLDVSRLDSDREEIEKRERAVDELEKNIRSRIEEVERREGNVRMAGAKMEKLREKEEELDRREAALGALEAELDSRRKMRRYKLS